MPTGIKNRIVEMEIAVFWYRRDLRIEDNTALIQALTSGYPVLPIFIFDTHIISELPKDDARISFIYEQLKSIHSKLAKKGKSIKILKGDPQQAWSDLIQEYNIRAVYFNKDYEPYAIERDEKIINLLSKNGIKSNSYKDQVIFEEDEVLKDDGKPYTVYTPYKRKWLKHFSKDAFKPAEALNYDGFLTAEYPLPSLDDIGFTKSTIRVRDYSLGNLDEYASTRDIPYLDNTSYLSPHLRFGTVSVRQIINRLTPKDDVFLSELIWREFFMQILYHFPYVVNQSFKPKYDNIAWRNDEAEFKLWCKGKTGYPMVDAGMRQLNKTGYMHNRVRMVTASFLCKHLLIDWRWGEAYFAQKLLDFELSSNNGNWQWAAGTGCDAAPYFRVFNPSEQVKKFDKELNYVKKWIPEFGTDAYSEPMVDHKFARERALETYKKGIV